MIIYQDAQEYRAEVEKAQWYPRNVVLGAHPQVQPPLQTLWIDRWGTREPRK